MIENGNYKKINNQQVILYPIISTESIEVSRDF